MTKPSASTKGGETRFQLTVKIRETALKAGEFGLERQHSIPILLPSSSGGAQPLKPIAEQSGAGEVSEAVIQDLVHQHPACLPIAEIDAMFSGAVPICTELNTPAGPIADPREGCQDDQISN